MGHRPLDPTFRKCPQNTHSFTFVPQHENLSPIPPKVKPQNQPKAKAGDKSKTGTHRDVIITSLHMLANSSCFSRKEKGKPLSQAKGEREREREREGEDERGTADLR